MAFAVLSHILCKVSDISVREQKHLIWLYRGASRIIYEGGWAAGAGGFDLIKCPYLYLEKQAWANSRDPDETQENVASDQRSLCLSLIQQFYTVLFVGYQMDFLG